jgi:hypothetical protein
LAKSPLSNALSASSNAAGTGSGTFTGAEGDTTTGGRGVAYAGGSGITIAGSAGYEATGAEGVDTGCEAFFALRWHAVHAVSNTRIEILRQFMLCP